MTTPWTPTKGTKTQRLAEARFRQLMWHSAQDGGISDTLRRQLPDAWRTLEMDLDVEEPKEKVTMYLDRSVIKMFRGMGRGYQARINRVLATWVQMKIAEDNAHVMTMMEHLDQANAEKDEPENLRQLRGKMQELAEHWAYQKGYDAGTTGT